MDQQSEIDKLINTYKKQFVKNKYDVNSGQNCEGHLELIANVHTDVQLRTEKK